MKKRVLVGISILIILVCAAAFSGTMFSKSTLSDLTKANVEALARKKHATVQDYARDILGCPGGKKNCFEGTINFAGAKLSGKWFLD